MPRISRHELFGIGHDHTHRPARSLSEEITKRQVHERSLTAKVTADRRDVNDDFFGGHADRIRETPLCVVRNFIAYPDVNRTRLPVYRNNARMGLEIRLMNMLRRERVFENPVGGAKSLLDIPESPGVMGIDIVDR